MNNESEAKLIDPTPPPEPSDREPVITLKSSTTPPEKEV